MQCRQFVYATLIWFRFCLVNGVFTLGDTLVLVNFSGSNFEKSGYDRVRLNDKRCDFQGKTRDL